MIGGKRFKHIQTVVLDQCFLLCFLPPLEPEDG